MLELFKKLFLKEKEYSHPEGFFGCISDNPKDTDWEIPAGGEQNLPMAKNNFTKLGILYNQNEVAKMGCTLFGSVGAFSDLTGYRFSIEELKRMWEACKSLGASETNGWYGSEAVQYLYKSVINNLGIGKFNYTKVIFGSDQFFNLLDKGYSIACGYRGNEEYNKDIMSDKDLDLDKLSTPSTYGHWVRIAKLPDGKYVLDNYSGSVNWPEKYMIKSDIVELYKNSIFFPAGYAFFYEEDLAKVQVDQKLLARLNNRVVFNQEASAFAIIKNGKAFLLDGKHMSELFKHKWGNTQESYVLGVNRDNWSKLGL